jgi:hypothetical protein
MALHYLKEYVECPHGSLDNMCQVEQIGANVLRCNVKSFVDEDHKITGQIGNDCDIYRVNYDGNKRKIPPPADIFLSMITLGIILSILRSQVREFV